MVSRLVLTGGPCAGKTSCLRAIQERFAGEVITAPETATLVLGSGFPPPGHERIPCSAEEWVRAFQGTILAIQQEVEAAFERLARNCRVRLIICDRGVLDGAAYWPGGRDDFLRHFGLSLPDCFARYRSVLHLPSLAHSHPHLYGKGGNEVRFESAAAALEVERAVRAAWQGHPGLKIIAAGSDVQHKIEQVLAEVAAVLATPPNAEGRMQNAE